MVFVRSLVGSVAVAIFGAILFAQLHGSGPPQVIDPDAFIKSHADFAAIYRWIFATAGLGFLIALRHPGDAGAASQGSRGERGSRRCIAPQPRRTRVPFMILPDKP
jgi:hypothetical protein